MKKYHKKILGYFLISLMFPIFLFFIQLFVQQQMPLLKDYNINLYLQPIIWGFIMDIFLGLMCLLINKAMDLLD